MSTVLLNGHPTWAKLPKKKGRTIVLLHGGLSNSTKLLDLLESRLDDDFAVSAFDRRGHGRTADTSEPFSYDAMADETIAFLELLKRRVFLLGHSDGGNVALLVALRRPDLVKRIAVVGANFHFRGLVPMPEFTPQSEGFEDFARYYASFSPDGVAHAIAVVEKSNHLIKTQPTLSRRELANITVPVLVMAGDDDVARLSHTVAMYESMDNAQLAIIPGASHSVLKERRKITVEIIKSFFLGPETPETRHPLRRANAALKE